MLLHASINHWGHLFHGFFEEFLRVVELVYGPAGCGEFLKLFEENDRINLPPSNTHWVLCPMFASFPESPLRS